MNSVTENELKAHQEKIGGKRVTLDALKANIAKEDYIHYGGSELTICVLTLLNGYTVTGQSGCADPAMYDREIGDRLAKEDAMKKIWPLMGYALRQEVYLDKQAGGSGDFKDRVRAEAAELQDKIVKLGAFINGAEQFTRLPKEDQHLMQAQYGFMCDYRGVLEARIKRF